MMWNELRQFIIQNIIIIVDMHQLHMRENEQLNHIVTK
jgi:hypothetical protein